MLAWLAASLIAPSKLVPSNGPKPVGLQILDISSVKSFGERCLAASAQGLYNSEPGHRDKVFLIWGEADRFWAGWLLKEKYVGWEKPLGSIQTLIRLVGTSSCVVSSPRPFHLNDIATTLAGIKRQLLVTDESLLSRFGIQIGTDLRGKFTTNAEAYRWIWKVYGSQISRGGASITVPIPTKEHNPAELRDYLVANRLFTFWVSGAKEAGMSGADAREEEAAVGEAMTKEIPANTPVFGYPWSGDGFGPGEGGGVTMISRWGHYLLATDNFTNLSVWSCFPASMHRLPSAPRPVAAQPDQKLCTLLMSDGDNLCTFQKFFPDEWSELASKDFPIAWTMGPLLRELAPPMFDEACRSIPPGDTVGSGVSGVGYMAMEEYSKPARPGFLAQTARQCREAGEDWLWIMRYGKPASRDLQEYGEPTRYRVILGGYGKVTEDGKASLERAGRTAVVHCIFNPDNPNGFEQKLAAFLARPDCPRCFTVFLQNWNYRPADIRRMAATLASHGVKIVTAEQLGDTVQGMLGP